MAAHERVTIYPRDLFKRGRPPKGAEKIAREESPEATRVRELEDQGKTVPEIAAALNVSERTVQRWRDPRLPRLVWEILEGDHPHFGGWARDRAGRAAFAIELRCPRCGKPNYHVAAAFTDEIAALLHQEFGRLTCPGCQRPGRFTLSRCVQLTIAEIREWQKARSRPRREELFHRAIEERPANGLLTGGTSQAITARQKARKRTG